MWLHRPDFVSSLEIWEVPKYYSTFCDYLLRKCTWVYTHRWLDKSEDRLAVCLKTAHLEITRPGHNFFIGVIAKIVYWSYLMAMLAGKLNAHWNCTSKNNRHHLQVWQAVLISRHVGKHMDTGSIQKCSPTGWEPQRYSYRAWKSGDQHLHGRDLDEAMLGGTKNLAKLRATPYS